MDRPQRPTRERRGALEIFLIGAVVAGLFYGGLRLIGDTHVAFDARKAERQQRFQEAREASMPKAATWGPDQEAEYSRLKAEAEERRKRYEAEQQDTRCIGGTLFKIDGNSYTNIGRC